MAQLIKVAYHTRCRIQNMEGMVKESTDFYRLFSNFHIDAYMYVHTHTIC